MIGANPIVCLDAAYGDASSSIAVVLFADWADTAPCRVLAKTMPKAAEYEPGAFYKRELPIMLDVLSDLEAVRLIVIDGYVWLGNERQPGLGAHLYQALDQRIPVVGIAKTKYRDDTWSQRVLRPGSARPLFITSVGIDPAATAIQVAAMHGDHRIPTLLRIVDHAARAALTEVTNG
jgi:deoxyribonuclease V